jgi:hypothetical protein
MSTKQLITGKASSTQNYKIIATGAFAVIFGLGLLFLIFFEGESKDYPTTLLISLAGCILGWVIGIITSPYDETDGKKIDKFVKMIGTFLSGYILAKLDKVFEHFLSVDSVKSALDNIYGIRALFFVSYFLLTWLVVFVYRLYATGDIPDAAQPNTKSTNTAATSK